MKLKKLLKEETRKRAIIVVPMRAAEGNFSFYVKLQFIGDYNSVTATFDGLKNLEGSPETFDNFFVANNFITSLVGGPRFINDEMNCDVNKLTDLMGAPLLCKNLFSCRRNNITSLKGIGKDYLRDCEDLQISGEYIKSNILGLLIVKNLSYISGTGLGDETWARIVYPYLNNTKDRDIMECKEELMNAGFKDYAKL
jgi:hypothetical protein